MGVARMECKTLKPTRGRGDNLWELLPSAPIMLPGSGPGQERGGGIGTPHHISCLLAHFLEGKTARLVRLALRNLLPIEGTGSV